MPIADPHQFLIDWQQLVRNQIDAVFDQQRFALGEQAPADQQVERVVRQTAAVLHALGLPVEQPPGAAVACRDPHADPV